MNKNENRARMPKSSKASKASATLEVKNKTRGCGYVPGNVYTPPSFISLEQIRNLLGKSGWAHGAGLYRTELFSERET